MTTTNALLPVVTGPDEDRAPQPINMPKHRITVKLRGQDTGGNFTVVHLRAEPMSGPPLHMHTREDEWFYILKGEMTFQVGDRRVTAGPGTSVFAPRDIPHTWQNLTSETVEAIGLVTPPDLEGFFLELVRHKTREELEVLMHQYGTVMLGPPISA